MVKSLEKQVPAVFVVLENLVWWLSTNPYNKGLAFDLTKFFTDAKTEEQASQVRQIEAVRRCLFSRKNPLPRSLRIAGVENRIRPICRREPG